MGEIYAKEICVEVISSIEPLHKRKMIRDLFI